MSLGPISADPAETAPPLRFRGPEHRIDRRPFRRRRERPHDVQVHRPECSPGLSRGYHRAAGIGDAIGDAIEKASAYLVSPHFFYMNWGRPNKSLAKPYPWTPAMAAGLADHIWTCEEIAALVDWLIRRTRRNPL